MSMTVAEARTEIRTRFEKADEIEKKYPEGLTQDANAEDYAEVKKLLTEVDGLEDQLAALEEIEGRKSRISGGVDKYKTPAEQMRHAQADRIELMEQRKSAGEEFIESGEYKRLADLGAFHSNTTPVDFAVPLQERKDLLRQVMQYKTLVASGSASGGAMIFPDIQAGTLELLFRQRTILDLVPRLTTSSNLVEYVREDSFTNSAAMTAEASATTGTSGTKPESALAFSAQTAAVKTLAHWIPVTNRMLDDAPAIRGIIDTRLLLGLQLVLEDQVINGNGSGENFQGILGTAGVLIQNPAAAGLNNTLDAIFAARTQIRVTGLANPNGVVLHPNDFQQVRLARESAASATLGGYLMGPPSQLGATTIFGMPVAEAIGEPENTALVGDFAMGATIFDREQSQIRVGLINDQFVRNMQTILAELRAAFVVWRPTAFCRVTGI